MEALAVILMYPLALMVTLGLYNKHVLYPGGREKFHPLVVFGCGYALAFVGILISMIFFRWWATDLGAICIVTAGLGYFFWNDAVQAVHYHLVSYPEQSIYRGLKSSDFKNLKLAEEMGKAIQEAVATMSLNPDGRHESWKIQNRTKKLNNIIQSLEKVNLRREKQEAKEAERQEIQLLKERERVNPAPSAEDVQRSKEIKNFADTSSKAIDDIIDTIRKKQ